jgi:hypothetical protein
MYQGYKYMFHFEMRFRVSERNGLLRYMYTYTIHFPQVGYVRAHCTYIICI